MKPRVKGPPCRGWEEMRRLQKRQRSQAVLEDSDSDEDYEPNCNPETELSSSDAEGTEHEPVSTVAEAPENDHQQSAVFIPQIPKGKKRMRQPENWLKNKKKKARNSGKQYTDYKGRIVHAKTLPDMTNHVCRRRCAEKVTPADVKECHDKFWELGDHTAQDAFLSGCIMVTEKDRNRLRVGGMPQGKSKPKTY